MLTVDLNCDMGESFGPWRMGSDAELMKYVSSVNVACGFHAGDATTMGETVRLAIENGVAIGAHPGYPDLQGFGRRRMSMPANEVHDIVLYQISALKGICEAHGARLSHVKPHGALYNQAAGDAELADAIIAAVSRLDDELAVYGLSNSLFLRKARAAGLETMAEVFADRTYQPDGTLTPRDRDNALITDPGRAASQVVRMVESGSVEAEDGTTVALPADTICIHGDGERAVDHARSIRDALTARGIVIRAPHQPNV